MTLQNRTDVYAPATLTDEQRRRVADALESAQSENTRKNYASQFHKVHAGCERKDHSSLPASSSKRFEPQPSDQLARVFDYPYSLDAP